MHIATVSDDESDTDVPDAIPARPSKADPKVEEDEDDDDEEDEDEFQVEKILSHKTERGKIVYRVKRLGWEKEEDQTWEPVDNLYVMARHIESQQCGQANYGSGRTRERSWKRTTCQSAALHNHQARGKARASGPSRPLRLRIHLLERSVAERARRTAPLLL